MVFWRFVVVFSVGVVVLDGVGGRPLALMIHTLSVGVVVSVVMSALVVWLYSLHSNLFVTSYISFH